jgi:hypothetical protein
VGNARSFVSQLKEGAKGVGCCSSCPTQRT